MARLGGPLALPSLAAYVAAKTPLDVAEYLLVSVPRLGEAFADASHTLTTSFTAGDTSLLTPTLPAAVPEPATLLLMSVGMLGLLVLACRRSGRF